MICGAFLDTRNYDQRYRGKVTVRQALEESLNVPTVQLAMNTGLPKVVETLRSLGVQSPLQPVPSLALGAFEVTPLELARAYATLDNEGQQPYLLTVKAVVTDTGEVQQQRHMNMTSVTSAARAYIITSMLEGVVQRGTAKSARSLGIDFPCAGKTGTTSDYADSWFVGYTTDMVALVWVGFDDRRATGSLVPAGHSRLDAVLRTNPPMDQSSTVSGASRHRAATGLR